MGSWETIFLQLGKNSFPTAHFLLATKSEGKLYFLMKNELIHFFLFLVYIIFEPYT